MTTNAPEKQVTSDKWVKERLAVCEHAVNQSKQLRKRMKKVRKKFLRVYSEVSGSVKYYGGRHKYL